jgi:hypothetical protein
VREHRSATRTEAVALALETHKATYDPATNKFTRTASESASRKTRMRGLYDLYMVFDSKRDRRRVVGYLERDGASTSEKAAAKWVASKKPKQGTFESGAHTRLSAYATGKKQRHQGAARDAAILLRIPVSLHMHVVMAFDSAEFEPPYGITDAMHGDAIDAFAHGAVGGFDELPGNGMIGSPMTGTSFDNRTPEHQSSAGKSPQCRRLCHLGAGMVH